MSTATASAASSIAPSLRRLYFVRFAFALVWAGLLLTTASSVNPVSVTLLVLYPVFDVAAAVVDARSSRNTTPLPGLYANVVISLVAAAGLTIAATAGTPGILRVWGTWAIVSGLLQLIVGIGRRALGGQWPMILSGAISTAAGTTFILQAAQDGAGLSTLAGTPRPAASSSSSRHYASATPRRTPTRERRRPGPDSPTPATASGGCGAAWGKSHAGRGRNPTANETGTGTGDVVDIGRPARYAGTRTMGASATG